MYQCKLDAMVEKQPISKLFDLGAIVADCAFWGSGAKRLAAENDTLKVLLGAWLLATLGWRGFTVSGWRSDNTVFALVLGLV